jgi:membrane-associated protease RseP (regulator of RpoE activity)
MLVVFLFLSGVLPSQSAWLGIDAEGSQNKITITEVLPGSPAKKAGLRVGDVILAFQGKKVGGDLDGLAGALAEMKPGSRVRFRILRKKKTLPLEVILGAYPSSKSKSKTGTRIPPKRVNTSKKLGVKAQKTRPFKPGTLGVGIAQQGEKIWVESVFPGSAAQKAGFKPGDRIVSVGGKAIKDVDRLVGLIRKAGAGNKLAFVVKRGGKALRLHAVLNGIQAAKPSGVARKRRIPSSQLPTKWFFNYETARTLSKQSNRPLLVEFFASWCDPCKLLEKSFKAKGVVPYLRRCVLVRVDVDKASRLADRFGVQSIPHVVLLSPSGKAMGTFTGYLPPDELAGRMRRFLGFQPKSKKRKAKSQSKIKRRVKKPSKRGEGSRPSAKKKNAQKKKSSEMEQLQRAYRKLLKRQQVLEARLAKILKMLEKIK